MNDMEWPENNCMRTPTTGNSRAIAHRCFREGVPWQHARVGDMRGWHRRDNAPKRNEHQHESKVRQPKVLGPSTENEHESHNASHPNGVPSRVAKQRSVLPELHAHMATLGFRAWTWIRKQSFRDFKGKKKSFLFDACKCQWRTQPECRMLGHAKQCARAMCMCT